MFIMKVSIDRDTCIGCAFCVSLCPELFTLDEGKKATVLLEAVPSEHEACAKEAEEGCPVNAITVE
jgi:ferredoxin